MMQIKNTKLPMQKDKNGKGTAEKRKSDLLGSQVHRIHGKNLPGAEGRGKTSPAKLSGGTQRVARSSVNRIEGKIKKCQNSQNPCNSGLNPIVQGCTVNTLLTIGCDCLTEKKRKFSRFLTLAKTFPNGKDVEAENFSFHAHAKRRVSKRARHSALCLAQWLNPPGKRANLSTHDEAIAVFAGKRNDRVAG